MTREQAEELHRHLLDASVAMSRALGAMSEIEGDDRKALADVERAVNSLSTMGVKDVYLLGFADNRGTYEKNLALSRDRARVVASRLQQRGLNVHPEGFSSDMPVADNSTAAGRQQNRRVELVVAGEVLGTSVGDTTSAPH